METPVHIDFQGLNANELFRTSVLQHVATLEERYGRITSCRVVVKAPSERHQTGGLYEISIRLALPQGREVNIDRTATADERHADPNFAINDAFKRARRRLQDHSQRMRGQVKVHSGQPIEAAMRVEEDRSADDVAR